MARRYPDGEAVVFEREHLTYRPRKEAALAAVVVLKGGEGASADELRVFCRQALAAFKVPLSDPSETYGLCPGHRKQVEGEIAEHRRKIRELQDAHQRAMRAPRGREGA